jgi:hypothetical protein
MKIFLLLLVSVVVAHAQDTIQPRWQYAVPSTIRHTSVRGEQIGIALDSTVIVIDRSSGTEIVRFATHRGVIEGIGLMPGDTTCVVVSASHDTAQKMIVNAVAEVDMRTGEELRHVDLATVDQQLWKPTSVETHCAITRNGRYLYTSSPRYWNSQNYRIEYGRYQTVDLVNFTVSPTGTGIGPYGSIGLSTDDRILMYWGSQGGLSSNPQKPGWEETMFGLIRMEKDTGVFWKTITSRLEISLNSRYFYDHRYLYDTLAVTPSETPELLGSINLRALCHNGKNYFSFPYKPGPDSNSITIRELGTNRIVHELMYDSSDNSYRWYLSVDDSLFIIAQQQHITCWPVRLQPELPGMVVHVIPDTMTVHTCTPATINTLPIALPFEVEVSVTNGTLDNGAVQFTKTGDQQIMYHLKVDGEVRHTDTHRVFVRPLPLHPLASWGMKVHGEASSTDTAWFPRMSPDGQYVALASKQWLAVATTNGSDLRSRVFTSQHVLTGAIVAPNGTAYVIHDSTGKFNSDGRRFYNQHQHLRFNSISIDGSTTSTLWRSYSSDQNVSVSVVCSPRWRTSDGWKVSLQTQPFNDSYSFSSTQIDGTTNTKLAVNIGDGHMPIVFDQDPQTGGLWWIGQPPGTEGWRTILWINAYNKHDGKIFDHGRFPLLRTMYFVANGSYIYADGKLYDKHWDQVGPDTTQPAFSGAFLGSRNYALHVIKRTEQSPCYLQIRRLPDGAVLDSVAFDLQIMGVDTDESGSTIVMTFRDGTLQVFAVDTLFQGLPVVINYAEDHNTLGSDLNTRDMTDTARPVITLDPVIPDTTIPNTARISPHPVHDLAEIHFVPWTSAPIFMTIRDMQGHVVYHTTVPTGGHVMYWARHDDAAQRVSAGVYALTVSDGRVVHRTLVIVE